LLNAASTEKRAPSGTNIAQNNSKLSCMSAALFNISARLDKEVTRTQHRIAASRAR
jgi:hypothetical protein